MTLQVKGVIGCEGASPPRRRIIYGSCNERIIYGSGNERIIFMVISWCVVT